MDDAAFDGSARRSAQLLKLFINRGMDRGYFFKPDKTLFISDTSRKEEATRQEFAAEGLELNLFSGSLYLGAYLVPQEDLVAWFKTQVETWAHRVRVLGKISQRHPQSDYSRLGILLQSKWQYLQKTFPVVGTLVGPIEEAIREKFFSALSGGADQLQLSANTRP